MKIIWKRIIAACIVLVALLGVSAGALYLLPRVPFGFAREISDAEQTLRMQIVTTAEGWLGTIEGDEQHKQIVDAYNAHEPLAEGYLVTYEDNWCATFVSQVAIQCGLTDIIPTECGCQRQIGLFETLNCWEEDDSYLPLPGDIIFYAWDESPFGDCSGWSDHVGIVAGSWGPFLKIIEGNMADRVNFRYILRNDPSIRGYGLPDYASLCD